MKSELVNQNLKNNCYYGGIAWYLLAKKVEDKLQEQIKNKDETNKEAIY